MISIRSLKSAAVLATMLGQSTLAAPAPSDQVDSALSKSWRPSLLPRSELNRRLNGPDNLTSVQEMCDDHDIIDFDPNILAAIWDETTAGEFLDTWIQEHGSTDWVKNMDAELMGGPATRDCSMADSCTAPEGSECARYVHKDAGPLFWILTAVGNFHDAYTYLHEKIQDNTIYDSLDVDKIIDDFDVDEPQDDSSLFAALAGAFTMAAGATAIGAPEVSAVATMFVGAFSLAAMNQASAIDPTIEVKEQMAQMFKATQDQIEATVNTALKGEGGLDKVAWLPNQSGGWPTHIAAFFDAGKFLPTDIQSLVDDAVDGAHYNMRMSIINTILKTKQFFVFVDNEEPEETCDGGGMIFAEDKCFSLWSFVDDEYAYADNHHDELWPVLEDYDYDLTTMYTESWRCAVDGVDSKPDIEPMPLDGSFPLCFYNIRVMQGLRHNDGGNDFVEVQGINTSDRKSAGPSQD